MTKGQIFNTFSILFTVYIIETFILISKYHIKGITWEIKGTHVRESEEIISKYYFPFGKNTNFQRQHCIQVDSIH